MTRDERKHLANVLAWARADGWEVRWRGLEKGPTNANPPCPRVEWDQHEQVLKIRRPAGVDGILRLPAFSVTQAIDLLASYDLLPAEMHSAYRAGVESIPWRYCVQTSVGYREFDSYDEAAGWARPTDEGHPQLPLLRLRRGPFEVAA